MSTSNFDNRLDNTLKFEELRDDPYGKACGWLIDIVGSLQNKMNEGLEAESIKIDAEPGFHATIGQQWKVVLRIPKKGFQDGLFRAYIPTGGLPISLDLTGDEPEQVGSEAELETKILDFLGVIRERMNSYREYARR